MAAEGSKFMNAITGNFLSSS